MYHWIEQFFKVLFLYVIQINSVVARSCWFKDSRTYRAFGLLTPYEYFGKIERNFFQLKSQVNEGWDKPSSQKIEMTDICSRRGEYNEVF